MPLTDLPQISVAMILHNIQLAAGPLTGVLFLLILTCLADVATGLFAAWKSGTLDAKYVDSFITSHIQNKWLPILGTLIGGIALGGVDNVIGTALVAAAGGQIVAYETQVFGSSLPTNLKDASAGTKGAPGTTALLSGTIESTIQSFEGVLGAARQALTFHPNGALASVTIAQPAADEPSTLDGTEPTGLDGPAGVQSNDAGAGMDAAPPA